MGKLIWKIDWENFAPSSSVPWSQFDPQNEKKEGVFRLLVRKRETSDETEKFYLSFYRAPAFDEDEDEFRVTESPEVELMTQSDLGQEFLGLWHEFQAGNYPYDSILARQLDPSNCMRIMVRLAWEENEREDHKSY